MGECGVPGHKYQHEETCRRGGSHPQDTVGDLDYTRGLRAMGNKYDCIAAFSHGANLKCIPSITEESHSLNCNSGALAGVMKVTPHNSRCPFWIAVVKSENQ